MKSERGDRQDTTTNINLYRLVTRFEQTVGLYITEGNRLFIWEEHVQQLVEITQYSELSDQFDKEFQIDFTSLSDSSVFGHAKKHGNLRDLTWFEWLLATGRSKARTLKELEVT